MQLHVESARHGHVHRRFAPAALMLGNIVTGCSVLAPAGMLIELSPGLGVSIRGAGLLIPELASASVSLNTSVLEIGQAIGSAIGGMLDARDLLYGAGYVATGFVALAVVVVILTKPRRAAAPST